jgi:hypothetical protein
MALLATEDSLDDDGESSPLKKRPGPKLIRPVNKKKNKMGKYADQSPFINIVLSNG